MLNVVSARFAQSVRNRIPHALTVIRMDQTKKQLGRDPDLTGFISKNAIGLVRPAQLIRMDVAWVLQVQFPTSEVRHALGRSQTRLTLLQCLGRPFAFGDIMRHDKYGFASLEPNLRPFNLNVDAFTILPLMAPDTGPADTGFRMLLDHLIDVIHIPLCLATGADAAALHGKEFIPRIAVLL